MHFESVKFDLHSLGANNYRELGDRQHQLRHIKTTDDRSDRNRFETKNKHVTNCATEIHAVLLRRITNYYIIVCLKITVY